MMRALPIALLLLATPAVAQSNLPDIPPATIAADAETTLVAGRRDVALRSFDPFEGSDDLQGEAWLRTSAGEIGHTGLRLPRGAVAEVEATYIAPTDDPRDARGFDRAEFPSGEPAQLVRYRTDVLECSSRVRRTAYRDDYYRGASHGLVMGVYGPYPRYRGFRDYGYGYGHGVYGYGSRGVRGARGLGGYRSGDFTPEERRRFEERRRRDELAGREPAAQPPAIGTRRSVTPGIRVGTGIGPLAEPLTVDRRREPVATRPSAVERARRGQPAAPAAPRRRIITVQPADAFPTPRPSAPARSRTPQRSQPRPEPRISAPPPRSAPPRPTQAKRPPRREVAPRTAKAPRPGKSHDLYPPLEPVDGQCAVRESIGVFVPWDRLDAARFDGLAVLLLDRDGREVPVWMPPNYVEGFRIATRRSR